jgi:hypothetical protein
MKEITLVASWRGQNGREQTVRYLTRYRKWRELTSAAERAPYLSVFEGW